MVDYGHTSDWRDQALRPGVLREPSLEPGRFVLWVPAENNGAEKLWLRVSTAARAAVVRRDGLLTVAATAIRAKQLVRGRLSRLLRRLRPSSSDRAWLVPNGEEAEQCGPRQDGLMFAWSDDADQPLDQEQARKPWPHAERMQSLGPRLLLLWGVAAPTGVAIDSLPADGSSLKQAEQWLADARRTNDRPGEVAALADVGLLAMDEGDVARAVACLEEGLTLARTLGDVARERDMLGNLGLALISAKEPDRARQALEAALVVIRAAGDRFAEKLVLERHGTACASGGDMPAALASLNEALDLARQLGDRQHEADLLWHLAIRNAEAGDFLRAAEFGHAAVDLLEKLGKPQARLYREHLQRFRQGDTAAQRRGDVAGVGGQFTASAAASSTLSADARGPGWLRMAISAAKALYHFVGSGLKTVKPDIFRMRLERCLACEYHTGLRCRVCGCFTNMKARLPHEECPLGQWPAANGSDSSWSG